MKVKSAKQKVTPAGSEAKNFGRTRGVIRYVVIRDCATEMMATFDELNLAALTVVR